MTTSPGTTPDGTRAEPATRLALGVAAPLGAVALAYGLWWISDRLLFIGPLDRAAFSWVVVIPVWLTAPYVAARAWRSLSKRATLEAAILIGSIVGIVAAVLFWTAVATPDCANGAVKTPTEWIVPSMFLGIIVGGGVAASGLVAVRPLRTGHPWWALSVGAAASIAMIVVAIAVFAIVASGPGCQRPPIA